MNPNKNILTATEILWYWPFAADAPTADKSGNGKTLTFVNSPTIVEGMNGGALKLVAASTQVATLPSQNWTKATPFSIELLVIPTVLSATLNPFFGNFPGASSTFGFNVSADSSNMYFSISDATTKDFYKYAAYSSALVGRRVHLVATYNGNGAISGMELYINTVAATLTSGIGTLDVANASTSTFNIGRRNPGSGQYGDCEVDFIRVYNRVLTPKEVAVLYFAKRGNQ